MSAAAPPPPASLLHTLTAWALAGLFLAAPQALIRPAWPAILDALTAAFPTSDPWFSAIAAGSILTNLALVVLFNLALLPVYWSGVADAYRCDASRPWPWAAASPPEERRAFWRTVAGSMLVVAFNSTAVAYAAILGIAPIARHLGAFATAPEAFPSTLTLALQLGACLVVEDALFYATHRALHSEPLYRLIHSWHHAFKSVIALSSENAHPVEYALANLLPVTLGPLLLRTHAFTFFWFIALRVAVSHDEHCGFTLPWSPVRLLPFGSSAAAHAWHHAKTDGMYASQFALWDWALGTDKEFRKWESRQGGKSLSKGKASA